MTNGLDKRTHCKNGHEWTPENTRTEKGSKRVCRACKRERKAKYMQDPVKRFAQMESDRAYAARKRLAAGATPYAPKEFRYERPPAKHERRLKALESRDTLIVEEVYDNWGSIDLAKNNPLAYLKLNPEQSKASDSLNFASDKTRPKCDDEPEAYIDYDERTPPTAVEAAIMCGGCKVMAQCNAFAMTLKPSTGVWAGRVWLDGKPQS